MAVLITRYQAEHVAPEDIDRLLIEVEGASDNEAYPCLYDDVL